MAASRKSRPSDLVAEVGACLGPYLQPGAGITAALSGGLDSVVLLDCLARLRDARCFDLAAIHVNHCLSPNAGSWAAFCADLCRERGLALRIVEVRVIPERGESIELAARRARYGAFRREVSGLLALAHHLDDQAETVLLQMLRGAGPRGMAAMPALRPEAGSDGVARGLQIVRPLLHVPRARLEDWVRAAGLAFVQDESNADLRHDRNLLRARVMPALAARFPGYRSALARSAALCAEASILLDELALADGMHALSDGTLDVGILQRLSPPRARNLLRWFLRTQGASRAPSAKRLGEALRQLVNARDDARLRIAVGDTELRRHLGRVHAVKVKAGAAESRSWQGEPVLPAPCGSGVVYFRPVEGSGIALARLSGRPVDLRVRAGGERLRPDCARPHRTLKNLLREARIAPWLRARMPLLYCDGELVWVPGIGIECGWQAQPGELGVMPDWNRSDTGSGVGGDRSLQSGGNKLSKQD